MVVQHAEEEGKGLFVSNIAFGVLKNIVWPVGLVGAYDYFVNRKKHDDQNEKMFALDNEYDRLGQQLARLKNNITDLEAWQAKRTDAGDLAKYGVSRAPLATTKPPTKLVGAAGRDLPPQKQLNGAFMTSADGWGDEWGNGFADEQPPTSTPTTTNAL